MNHRIRGGSTIALACCTWWLVIAAEGLCLDQSQAIRAGRDALAKKQRFPWYDHQSEDVRFVEGTPQEPPPRTIDWEANIGPQANTSGQRSFFQRIVDFLKWLFAGNFQILMWIFIVVLIVLTIVALYRATIKQDVRTIASYDQEESRTDSERIENLPLAIKRGNVDLLSEARRLYEAGNYSEAIVYYYSHLLIQLDRNHLIRLTKGKTNRQYLSEIGSRDRLPSIFRTTMILFEESFFGRHVISREQFESCWGLLPTFDELIQQPAGPGVASD